MNLKVFRATGVLFHVSLLVTFLGQKILKTLRMFALLKASLVGFIYIFSSLFSNSFTFKTIYFKHKSCLLACRIVGQMIEHYNVWYCFSLPTCLTL